MKITRGQIRKIIKESLSEELYVVIGNAGHGRQNLWPESENPKALPKAEAEKIAKELKDSQGRGGWMQIHYHAKPVSQAAKYVSGGQPASAGLWRLLDELGYGEDY